MIFMKRRNIFGSINNQLGMQTQENNVLADKATNFAQLNYFYTCVCKQIHTYDVKQLHVYDFNTFRNSNIFRFQYKQIKHVIGHYLQMCHSRIPKWTNAL